MQQSNGCRFLSRVPQFDQGLGMAPYSKVIAFAADCLTAKSIIRILQSVGVHSEKVKAENKTNLKSKSRDQAYSHYGLG